MKPIAKLILLGAFSAIVLPLPHAKGQDSIFDKTTLGQSQNDARDLANSLAPGPQRFGKGEKKEQVSTAELKSKTTKDTTFGGSLMNIGIAGAAPKLDEQKQHNASSEEAKPSKESHAPSTKESKQSGLREEQQSAFSNLSETATLAESIAQADAEAKNESKASNSTATSSASQAQDKQPRSTSTATTDEKSSPTSTEKSSTTTKPDGGGH
jgi:hypothetical protein